MRSRSERTVDGGHLPNTEHPVVTLVRVRKVSRFGCESRVVDVSIGVELVRLRVPGGVVVHRVGVQNENGVLGDELSAVGEVSRVDVGGTEPEGIMATLDFLDDGVDVGQVLLVLDGWETVAANDSVNFFLGLLLDFRVGRDQSGEPLHDGSSLEKIVLGFEARRYDENSLSRHHQS